ncbi:hypothetical protein BG003_005499 [Podila horticola]|nr:hypothetical protein BG003_005499 [Podila horticola]
MGQKMRESASATVTLPGLSKGSSVSIVPNGSSGPFQPKGCLDLDSALMPPPKYFPKRVAKRAFTSEDQFMDEDGSMHQGDVVPLHNGRVPDNTDTADIVDMDITADFGFDDQGKQGYGPRSITDDLVRIVGLESELCELIE